MVSHGEITADIARKITDDWNKRGYDVFYDHGVSSKNTGKIVSVSRKDYKRGDELSQLDIAIVERAPGKKVIALVEIEETSDRPKTILGDVFGALFGKHLFFKRTKLRVGEFTTLFVVGIKKTKHEGRNRYIQGQVNKVKASLDTQNSSIGNVLVMVYRNEGELIKKFPLELESLVKGE